MKNLCRPTALAIALIGLCCLTTPALSQSSGPKVANCPSGAVGSAWAASVWLPCTPAATYALPTNSLIVATQRGTVNEWLLASNLLPTDQVYTDTPNPAHTSSDWWPVSQITFTGAVTPPVGIASLTLSWVPPTQNTDGSALSSPIASYDVTQGGTVTANVLAPATTYVTPLLPAGTYVFSLDAKEQNGSVSAQSNTATGTVTAVTPPPKCPTQPANATQQAACPTGTTGTFTQTHSWIANPYPTCWTVAPWTPTTPPAGSCPPVIVPPPPPTKITVTCTIPAAAGAISCPGTAQ